MAGKPVQTEQKTIKHDTEKSKPDAQKTVKKRTEKHDRQEKKNKKSLTIIVVAVFVAAVIALAVITVTSNLFGGRDAILSALSSMDPGYDTVRERAESLAALETALSAKEESLVKKEAALAETAAELEQKSEAMDTEKTNSSFELYVASLSEERIVQFEQLGVIYSNMTAEQTAAALSEMDSEMDMAVVIYYMEPESSAAVMDCLDSKLAAQITESLLK